MLIDVQDTPKSWQEIYRLAISFINPRPIALVSTVSADGIQNVAPFSFFNMVSANPPVLMICPSRRRNGSRKDTQVNIEATGHFVVASATADIVEKLHQASANYPPQVSEFEAVGLTPAPASKIAAPLVADSPVNCECKLDRIIEYGDQVGAGAVIFGRIVAIHVRDDVLADDGLVDPEKLRTVGRMGRLTYSHTTQRFDLPAPQIE